MTVSYRYIGKGKTDANGVAHLTTDAEGNTVSPPGYVGAGVGEIDVVASIDKPIASGSVVSQPYPVIDATFFDTGLEDSTSNVVLSRMSRTKTSDGAVITATGNNAWAIMKQNSQVFSNNCIIEFDLVANETPSGQVGIDLSTSGDVYQQKIWFDDLGHYKIQVTPTGITALTGSQSISAPSSFPQSDIRISLFLSSSGESATYKDFVVYPI